MDTATAPPEAAKKRRLLTLLRRKDAKADGNHDLTTTKPLPVSATNSRSYHPTSPISPPRSVSGLGSPTSTSPRRITARSPLPSPRLLSPASSLIFERDVQEPVPQIPADAEGNIPTHFTTEDRIPPVLEASSIAIAGNVDPDAVEILTSSAHIPAALRGTGSSYPPTQSASQSSDGLGVWSMDEGAMSNSAHSAFGGVDGADVRRLSFISFADVVQAEHAELQHHSFTEGLLGVSPPLSSGRESAKSPHMSSIPGSPVGSFGSGGEGVVTETMSKALGLVESSGEGAERKDY